jgi:hypothetical protein
MDSIAKPSVPVSSAMAAEYPAVRAAEGGGQANRMGSGVRVADSERYCQVWFERLTFADSARRMTFT